MYHATFHLISSTSLGLANFVARELGLKKHQWKYIPVIDKQEREIRLRSMKNCMLSRQLHGVFSPQELHRLLTEDEWTKQQHIRKKSFVERLYDKGIYIHSDDSVIKKLACTFFVEGVVEHMIWDLSWTHQDGVIRIERKTHHQPTTYALLESVYDVRSWVRGMIRHLLRASKAGEIILPGHGSKVCDCSLHHFNKCLLDYGGSHIPRGKG